MIQLDRVRTEHDEGARSAHEYGSPPGATASDEAAEGAEGPISPWQGVEGLTIMFAGVVLPLFAIVTTAILNMEAIWHMALRHPLETLVQAALVAAIPLGNNLVWIALVKNDGRNPGRMGLISGVTAGMSLLIFGISIAAVILKYPTADVFQVEHPFAFVGIAAVTILSAAVSLVLCERLRRSKGTRRAQSLSAIFSLFGVLLTLTGIGISEAHSAFVRYAELLAVSESPSQRETGLTMLRVLNPEYSLRLECTDPRTAGLAGLFFPIDSVSQKQVYFAVTGKPFHDDKTADVAVMTDDYLKRHVVGSPVAGLSLVRSALTGDVNSHTLSSTFNWTFVFKNKSFNDQEARAELALPPGAAISGLTLWMAGKPHQAAFAATDKVKGAYNWVNISKRDPALVTDLGHGRVLLQCAPVPSHGEMKVSLSVSVPMKLNSESEATVILPKFQDQNFAQQSEPSVRLHSNSLLSLNMKGIRNVHATNDTDYQLVGTLRSEDLSSTAIAVRAQRNPDFKPIVAQDVTPGRYVIQTIKKVVASAPTHLFVVLDGSSSLKSNLEEVKQTLSALPKNVQASLIVARESRSLEPVPLNEGLSKLTAADFKGGEDNLPAMIKAAEEAGQLKGSALLWIHGPQPSLNQEMYIMEPFTSKPSFFELALDKGTTSANEFFKNHQEIGPFESIERNGNVKEDLGRFIQKWKPGSYNYAVTYKSDDSLPLLVKPIQNEERIGMLKVYGKASIDTLLAAGQRNEAAEKGALYRLVTPVTGAVVLERQSDYQYFGMQDPNSSQKNANNLAAQMHAVDDSTESSAPQLQGATFGTVGPQGSDATVIMGVNTAGTVRVNNMANLEIVLNILANGGEILGLAIGAANVAFGFAGKSTKIPFKMEPGARIVIGLALVALGLAIPGMINWLVASARDCNCFS